MSKKDQISDSDDESLGTLADLYELNAVRASSTLPKFMISLKIENRAMEFEVNLGAACTLIGKDTYCLMWPRHPPALDQEDKTLHAWSGRVRVLDTANVYVLVSPAGDMRKRLQPTRKKLVRGTKIRVGRIHNIAIQVCVTKVLNMYDRVFDSKIIGHNGPPVHLQLKEDTKPHFLKARPVRHSQCGLQWRQNFKAKTSSNQCNSWSGPRRL